MNKALVADAMQTDIAEPRKESKCVCVGGGCPTQSLAGNDAVRGDI